MYLIAVRLRVESSTMPTISAVAASASRVSTHPTAAPAARCAASSI
jgi:hypothetical protein